MAKVLDCGLEVYEFEFQSRYHVHFWANDLLKRYELPYLSSYGVNITAVLQGWIWY